MCGIGAQNTSQKNVIKVQRGGGIAKGEGLWCSHAPAPRKEDSSRTGACQWRQQAGSYLCWGFLLHSFSHMLFRAK
jgi:hypothetical protein